MRKTGTAETMAVESLARLVDRHLRWFVRPVRDCIERDWVAAMAGGGSAGSRLLAAMQEGQAPAIKAVVQRMEVAELSRVGPGRWRGWREMRPGGRRGGRRAGAGLG